MRSYSGSCHCGRVRFTVRLSSLVADVCNCSICNMKGFVHAIVPPADFELLAGADALQSYRFNTGTAEHTFCRHCGVHPFYTPRSDPDKVDVNVRCLDGVELSALQLRDFDGKHWEDAIKQARWQQ